MTKDNDFYWLDEEFVRQYVEGGSPTYGHSEVAVVDPSDPEIAKWLEIREGIVRYFADAGGPGTFEDTERYDYFTFVRYHLNRALNPYGGWPSRLFHYMGFDPVVGLGWHIPTGWIVNSEESYRAWKGQYPAQLPGYQTSNHPPRSREGSLPKEFYDLNKPSIQYRGWPSYEVRKYYPYKKSAFHYRAVILKRAQVDPGSTVFEDTMNFVLSLLPGSYSESFDAGQWVQDWSSYHKTSPLPTDVYEYSFVRFWLPLYILKSFIRWSYILALRADAMVLPAFPFVSFVGTYPYEIIRYNWLAIRDTIDAYFNVEGIVKEVPDEDDEDFWKWLPGWVPTGAEDDDSGDGDEGVDTSGSGRFIV